MGRGVVVTFAEWMRARMDELGLTQDQVAEAAGITQQTISKYVNGKAKPKAGHVRTLARALRVEPSELLDHVEVEPE
jgi:transcriptional regulator with XRE-family HTH domain